MLTFHTNAFHYPRRLQAPQAPTPARSVADVRFGGRFDDLEVIEGKNSSDFKDTVSVVVRAGQPVSKPLPRLKKSSLTPYTGLSAEVDPIPPTCKKAPLTHALNTYGMYQCNAFVAINQNAGWHYMAHITPWVPKRDLLRHFQDPSLRLNKFQDCELYLCPGAYEESAETLRTILETLDDLSPGVADRVHLVHLKAGEIAIASYNGKIGSSDTFRADALDGRQIPFRRS